MKQHQRVIVAIGMVFIVALGLWPPFQYRGQYEGQHFLLDPAYNSARIDLVRLAIGWVAIALIVAIVLLLYRTFSIRAIKIFGITLAVILVITAGVVVVVRSVRENTKRQVNAALVQQARNDLAALRIASPSEGRCVLSNPTKWVLRASMTVDYTTPQHVILFSDNKSSWTSSALRPYGQEILEIYPLRYLSQGQLPEKIPFVQRVSVKCDRAGTDDKTVDIDAPVEVVAERYFVFYPEEWGWDEPTKTSYLLGPAEFKEVSASTQKAPARRLANPPTQQGQFKLSDIEPDPEALIESRKKLGRSSKATTDGKSGIVDQMDHDLGTNHNARRRPQ